MAGPDDKSDAVTRRLTALERWREDQETRGRATQRSLAENDVRDQVVVNMIGSMEEKLLALQKGVDAMTEASAVAAATNRSQTIAVKEVAADLAVTSSMAPVVARLRRRLPAYVAIAAILGGILAAFVQAYVQAMAVPRAVPTQPTSGGH